MEGQGFVVGKKAPDFTLPDHRGETFSLSEAIKEGPLLIAFYPGDFTPVCTKQLCNYRDAFDSISSFGLRIYGISKNTVEQHAKFAEKYDFPFELLSDPKNQVAKIFGCTSLLMMGGVSRAVFIVNKQQVILYRYVEPTILTHRKADELVGILKDLREHKLI